MIEIKDLLSKFNNLILSQETKLESIRGVLSEVLEVELESNDIKIKNNVIYLNIKPIYKNQLFIKQDLIFLKLKKIFNKTAPQNIR